MIFVDISLLFSGGDCPWVTFLPLVAMETGK